MLFCRTRTVPCYKIQDPSPTKLLQLHSALAQPFHTPLQFIIMSSYQMKKSLRKSAGAAKSYAQIDDDGQQLQNEGRKDRQLKQSIKESIFQNKNWSLKQKVKLMVFFTYYILLPDWGSERRSIHLYKHLSNFIKKSRTPQQCKNMHSLLKRKFMTFEAVIEAMRRELHREDNYKKLLNRYEREIEAYELQNKLKDTILDEQKRQSLRQSRAAEPDDRSQSHEAIIRQDGQYSILKDGQYSILKDGREYYQALGCNGQIKREEAPPSHFQSQRERLVMESNFYFRQWLKYTLIYKQRAETA